MGRKFQGRLQDLDLGTKSRDEDAKMESGVWVGVPPPHNGVVLIWGLRNAYFWYIFGPLCVLNCFCTVIYPELEYACPVSNSSL